MIDKIVIHCSDTPSGRPDTAEDIHRWHQERGWDGIGYHYVICLDGSVQRGRPDYWKGAHAGKYNTNSIGICLIGRDAYNEDQMDALYGLLVNKLQEYPDAKVCGHSDLDPKKPQCPGFDLKNWLECHNMGERKL